MSAYKNLGDRLKNNIGSADFNMALAEAVEIINSLDAQKPAAWWYPKGEQFALASKDGSRPFAKVWEPLYAAPVAAQPQQASKPLSDAEILGCAHDKTTGLSPWGIGSIKTDYLNAVRRTITAFCQKNGIKERG